MINISVNNRQTPNDIDVLGAIICHTPKSLILSENKTLSTGQSCQLINNLNDLETYFGDPYINPSLYSDFLIAYKLVERGIPLYISSVYDMYDMDDEFKDIHYNGYTEFYFKEDGFDVVGYKLKSNIKFVIPLINKLELLNDNNKLYFGVSLYYLDREIINKNKNTLIEDIDKTLLYKTLWFTLNIEGLTDQTLIDEFKLHGLELKVIYNSNDKKALIKYLLKHAKQGLKVQLFSVNDSKDTYIENEFYHYDIHINDYQYCLNSEDTSKLIDIYNESIKSLSAILKEPTHLTIGRLFQSKSIYNLSNELVSSILEPLDSETQIIIYNDLLSMFPEDCNTYLFINLPDVSISTALELLSNNELNEQYNCDLFFGYAVDSTQTSLANNYIKTIYYSAALLSFYNLLLSTDAYITNNLIDLNISNNCIKIIIPESSAKKLQNIHCNSIVTFDTGYPSIFGDRTLSTSHNLKYSHISRNLITIRRLINNYLETKKFILNTLFNINACLCYIKFNILDEFKSRGAITSYKVIYTTEGKTVFINIALIFPYIAEEIIINFTI